MLGSDNIVEAFLATFDACSTKFGTIFPPPGQNDVVQNQRSGLSVKILLTFGVQLLCMVISMGLRQPGNMQFLPFQ